MARRRREHVEPLVDVVEKPSTFYPDLAPAIQQLQEQHAAAENQTQHILEKWLTSLVKVQKEMRHLERIEQLSRSLKNVHEQ